MELAQEERAAQLQRAVINGTIQEIVEVYDALGYVEMSAPALGLACRFRGLEVVKVLVEKGATFDFPSTEEIEIKYHCHIGEKHAQYRENYRTNYALYFLKCYRGGVKGARCLQGMKFFKNQKRDDGTLLPFLADSARSAVLDYLLLNQKKLAFQPEELLFYAIFARDDFLYEELKKRRICLAPKRIHAMTEGTLADGYWFEFGTLTGKLADRDFVSVMQRLSTELDGKPFRLTEKTFDSIQNRFHDFSIFEFFLEHFRREKMQPAKIMRCVIDRNLVEAMPLIEREGWLGTPRKREEMIAYTAEQERTELLAWLLDFKNRTADFAAEQEKADKRLMRKLNATLDSVMALSQLWSYKKTADGTLTITNYKGSATEVTVPEKIGKSIVTAIGKGTFTGEENQCRNNETMNRGATKEQIRQHKKITKIVLPDTIQLIGAGAFQCMEELREINIPAGVREIGEAAFAACAALRTLTIPPNVKRIGKKAFLGCAALETVYISEGVEELGAGVFAKCSKLRKVYMPASIQCIRDKEENSLDFELFAACPDVTVICPKQSVAES